MPTTTTEEIETYIVDVPRTWLGRFLDEAICDDARGYILGVSGNDETLAHTASILDKVATPVSITKKIRRLALTWDEIEALWRHAEWYAYYWGECCSSDAYDSGEMLGYISAGRASKAFAKRLSLEHFAQGLD